MKLQDLFEYLKENLYSTVADALQVNHFILDKDEPLLVQLPYSNDFVFRFYYYLQLRIFISHGYLIPGFDMNTILSDVGSWTQAEINLPAKNLCEILKDKISFKDNQLQLGLRYLANDGHCVWEFDLKDNVVTIKDWINGWDDGSVLENYLSDYDKIASWQKSLLAHFGGYMDENRVCLDVDVSSPDDFVKGIIKYLYMTVLISSGHRYLD